MYVKSKVQHGCALGQLADIAIGCKDENLARSGLRLEALRKRVCRLLQHLAQAAEPLLRGLRALIHALIAPVCGDTSLSNLVHTLGANLNLHPAALARRYGRMKRLVAVRLGDSNPVAHTLGVGRVAVADNRIYGPAELLLHLARAVDNDAQGEDVIDALEGNVLLAHLIPDRVNRLGAALDMVVKASNRLQLLLDGDKEAGDEGLALALGLLQAAADILIILRLQPLQSQILQLALERVEAQLMGDGGIEIHTLPALLAALLGREDLQLAHNLQTVGQLDKNHARVLRVADNHIAEILGLLLRHLELDI